MTWQFTPIIFLYTVSAVLCAVLAYRIWQMRPRPARGATWAMSLLVGCTIWATGSALEVSLADLASKLIVVRFVLYFGVALVVFSWSVFAIEYSAFDRWLNRYTIAALAVVPILAYVAVTTNPLHFSYSMPSISWQYKRVSQLCRTPSARCSGCGRLMRILPLSADRCSC